MRQLIREQIETVLLALAIFLALQASVQHFKVNGSSMNATLVEDERLVVNKLVYFHMERSDLARFLPFVEASDGDVDDILFAFQPPQHGDVVIFRYPVDPTRDFVKRVVGVPGDTIEIERGQVFRNGVPIEEDYITNPDTRTRGPVYVPENSYYVLGDNRRASRDSREWGVVPLDNLVGRMWFRYWPIDWLSIPAALR